MALIADSGAIYALYDARDRHHKTVTAALDKEREPIVVPMALLAEVDYLLRMRLGRQAVSRFLDGVKIGGYTLEPFTAADVIRCQVLLQTYADLGIGLADASVIATAERLNSQRILTIDERHFRAVRSAAGKPFTLLPADA